MSPQQYDEFLHISGALLRLVVLSILVERGLAFIFEYNWFLRVATRKVAEANAAEAKARRQATAAHPGNPR